MAKVINMLLSPIMNFGLMTRNHFLSLTGDVFTSFGERSFKNAYGYPIVSKVEDFFILGISDQKCFWLSTLNTLAKASRSRAIALSSTAKDATPNTRPLEPITKQLVPH
jgi:hypothetical protein